MAHKKKLFDFLKVCVISWEKGSSSEWERMAFSLGREQSKAVQLYNIKLYNIKFLPVEGWWDWHEQEDFRHPPVSPSVVSQVVHPEWVFQSLLSVRGCYFMTDFLFQI